MAGQQLTKVLGDLDNVNVTIVPFRLRRRRRRLLARGASQACQAGLEPRLRAVVEAKLAVRWSPQQIAGWLPLAYP